MRHFEFDAFNFDVVGHLELAEGLAKLVIELLLSLGVLLVLAAVVSSLTAIGVGRIAVITSTGATSASRTASSSVDGVRVHIVSGVVRWALTDAAVSSTLESEQLLRAETVIRVEASCNRMHTWNAWRWHPLRAHDRVSHGSCRSCSLHQASMHLLGLHLACVGIWLHVVEVAESRLGRCGIVLKSAGHTTLQLIEMVEMVELLIDS